jgi:hypothetical protein
LTRVINQVQQKSPQNRWLIVVSDATSERQLVAFLIKKLNVAVVAFATTTTNEPGLVDNMMNAKIVVTTAHKLGVNFNKGLIFDKALKLKGDEVLSILVPCRIHFLCLY